MGVTSIVGLCVSMEIGVAVSKALEEGCTVVGTSVGGATVGDGSVGIAGVQAETSHRMMDVLTKTKQIVFDICFGFDAILIFRLFDHG
jgi:hypothetical protein